ncbi:MAG TPA: hypothetical protein DCM28_23280 [Phycisphaerales bacterium]|nr:hypothetical protein [Phycisphaerales bacterium]|tara:strand:+ start:1136 stop:2893 length:1758 start_codon:yes stop_codon:yes gene_type:complete
MQQNLIGLWHFDENSRHLANNALQDGQPLSVHGALRTPRRFGQALELHLPGDRVTGKGPGRLLCGSVCFWAQVNGGRGQVDLLNIQGMIQITVDLSQGLALVVNVDDRVLVSQTRLTNGQWHHIAVTFNPDGVTLYLDAQKTADAQQPFAGLSVSNSRQNYMQIGPLTPAAKPVLIDELALFNIDLAPAHVHDLLEGVLEPTLPDQSAPQPGMVDATPYIDRKDPTCGIQKAVNALGPAGGIVTLPMGRFTLRQSIKLPSRTVLKGAGFTTSLQASPPVATQLMTSVKAGTDHVQVEDTSLLEVGDDVLIASPAQTGWNATRLTITRIDGQRLWFNGPTIADYDANAPAMVCHWFPLLSVLGQSQVHISDIHLMGNQNSIGDTPFGPDHACSAVQLMGAGHCIVERLLVEDWSHDGIGLYDSRFTRVQQNAVRNSLGHGIRIGDQSGGNWIIGNHCQLNAGVGIYLSTQTQPCIVSENVLTYNTKGGIATRTQTHQIKMNLTPPAPQNATGTSEVPGVPGVPGLPENVNNVSENILIAPAVKTKAPKSKSTSYTNDHISDMGSSAAATHNEHSVSRRMRGLDAFD